MKKTYRQFFISALSLTALLFASCDKADYTNDSTIEVAQDVKGTIAFVAPLQATQTVNEKDAGKYQYTINITEAQPVDIHLAVKLKSGTAIEGEDFTYDHHLIIKAYATSVTGNIAILSDDVFEPTKNFVLEVGGDVNISNAAIPASTISFNITNYVSDVLDISFAWDKTIDGYSTGANIDFDIFVANAAGYDNNDPWATYNDTGYAATGDEPEHLSMDMADWADGEYILFHDLYSNGFYGYGEPANVAVPIVATFVRTGAFTTEVTQDPSQTINANTTNGAVDDNGDSTGAHHNGFIAKVTIANGVFTITDYSGAKIATGKVSGSKKTSKPASIKKK